MTGSWIAALAAARVPLRSLSLYLGVMAGELSRCAAALPVLHGVWPARLHCNGHGLYICLCAECSGALLNQI
jgi:hypothetical protein